MIILYLLLSESPSHSPNGPLIIYLYLFPTFPSPSPAEGCPLHRLCYTVWRFTKFHLAVGTRSSNSPTVHRLSSNLNLNSNTSNQTMDIHPGCESELLPFPAPWLSLNWNMSQGLARQFEWWQGRFTFTFAFAFGMVSDGFKMDSPGTCFQYPLSFMIDQ